MGTIGLAATVVSVAIFLFDYESGLSTTSVSPELLISPDPDEVKMGSSLISFKPDNVSSWRPWVDNLNRFMSKYEEREMFRFSTRTIDCDFQRKNGKDEVCVFHVSHLGEICSPERYYGYLIGRPCVMLYLEKVVDWVPVPYNSSSLPNDMPTDLQDKIKAFRPDGSMIWMSCDGEFASDRENIGPIQYWPNQGVPAYFFPFIDIPGYLSPMVAVRFVNPQHGVLINIECKAWAQNIVYNRLEQSGSIHFELLIE